MWLFQRGGGLGRIIGRGGLVFRLIYAIGLAGFAFVVSRVASAVGLSAWIGISGAAGLFLMAIFTATLGPFASV